MRDTGRAVRRRGFGAAPTERALRLPDRLAAVALAVALVLGCLAAVPAGAAVSIRDVRVESAAERTRLVFELSGPVRHAAFPLDDPDRFVVDLSGARFDAKRVRLPPGQGVVKAVRIAPRSSGQLRIVIDLDRRVPGAASVATSGGRHRLVVDLGAPAAAVAAAPVVPPQPAKSVPPPRDLVIAVDAGHGGVDPGAIGRQGTREKDVTLQIARTLARRIDAEPGMRAVLIRTGDHFVPLRERIRRARTAQADLFISVHADAVANRSVSGSSVYILSPRGASSEAAKWLADRENAADLVGGVSLDDKNDRLASVLLDLSQSAALASSSVAADRVLDRLNRVGTVRRSQVQQAGFVVLKSPDIPSMLIETAFITNPGDEKRLRDPRHQARLADAITAGVRDFFHESPPPGTQVAARLARTESAGGPADGSPRALAR